MKFALPVAVLWTLMLSSAEAQQGPPGTSRLLLGAALPAEPITANTIDGRELRIGVAGADSLQVLCFLGTECPLAKLYGARLQELADALADRGVGVVGVFSNRQDSVDEIHRYVADHELRFPMVKDTGNRVADSLGATRTPEVFVFDASGQLRYQGRIDDQYAPGVIRQKPDKEDLREALQALLAGRGPAAHRTEAVGCIIGRVPQVTAPAGEALVTYSREVSRILQRHCVECHREGEIGPFALDTYDEVVGWGETMVEAVEQGSMPPWHAGPPHDRFVGARAVPVDELAKLRRWVDQGMPQGDSGDLPAPKQYVNGWDLPRTPDVELAMAASPMRIPAIGTVEYQYFVIDPEFEQDRWVQAAQVVPGNASVVHHAICFVRPPDGSAFRGVGWLGAYVPGQRAAVLREGHARLIPAGSKLVFQMHYTPTGKPETDITRVGIVFADAESVTHEVVTQMAVNQSFEIPPGAARHRVAATRDGFPDGGQLLSVMPHMHYRGLACAVDVVRGGEREQLLDVPRYDFNWQHDYRLVEPLDLSDVERLEFTATFDNSAENPWNPDPSQTVMWGDQTWEEMAVAFFDVAIPLTGEPALSGKYAVQASEEADAVDQQLRGRRQRFVDDFFRRFDGNGDGRIEALETPDSFRTFGMWQFDANDDAQLERQEIIDAAARRIGS